MSLNERGKAALARGDKADAIVCFDAAVADDPTDWESIAFLASMHFDADRLGHAYTLGRIAANLHPSPETYSDLARVHTRFGEWDKALEWLEAAHAMDPLHAPTINNAGMALINLGRHDEALEWFERCPEYRPDIEKNKAFVHLMRQDWAEGWRCYDLGIGSAGREKRHENLIPFFGGEAQRLVIYGEQGIGDEILFASCIPDVKGDVIIETMPRLVGLFRRSFPWARVYGTRYEDPWWYAEEKPRNAISVAALPGLFRRAQEDFPGEPYLVACGARRAMMRGLMDPLPRKKKIGIAWTGGSNAFDKESRSIDIHALVKAFEGVDAELVSLEHTPTEDVRMLGVHAFPFITNREQDYDWTAALVAELDLVVSVPTAVAHLSGALGKKALVMLNDPPQWRCGGPTMPWYQSMEVMRDWTLESVAARVNEVLHGAE